MDRDIPSNMVDRPDYHADARESGNSAEIQEREGFDFYVPNEHDRYDRPIYEEGGFHPVFINEIYNDRYRVLRKLGYGTYSTVWLVQCSETSEYFAMKVLTQSANDGDFSLFELPILRQLRDDESGHPGSQHVLHLVDDFEIEGPNGYHMCMVFPLMGQDLVDFGSHFEYSADVDSRAGRTIPTQFLKVFIKQILLALDFAHSNGIVHTDISPQNVLIQLPNPEWTVAQHLEDTVAGLTQIQEILKLDNIAEIPSWHNPSVSMAQWLFEENTLENFQNLSVVLADWGMACWEDHHLSEEILPERLQPPESLLKAPWNSKVDIWALGCIMFELQQGISLFHGIRAGKDWKTTPYANFVHLSEIIDALGGIPQTLLEVADQDRVQALEFSEDGIPKRFKPPAYGSLESRITYISGKEKDNFITMLRSMLTLDPAKRKSARELLEEPWLNEDHFSGSMSAEGHGDHEEDSEEKDYAESEGKEAENKDKEVDNEDEEKHVDIAEQMREDSSPSTPAPTTDGVNNTVMDDPVPETRGLIEGFPGERNARMHNAHPIRAMVTGALWFCKELLIHILRFL